MKYTKSEKVCSLCGISKMFAFFFKDKSKVNGISSACKSCMSDAQKVRFKNPITRKKQSIKVRKYRQARKEWLVKLRGGKCDRCFGVFDEVCYDFHHIDNETKEFHVGQLLNYSKEEILAEASKCLMLCANCHRLTHKEMRNAIQ